MGTNPYQTSAPPPPKKAYTVTLRNTGQEIRVDPSDLPDQHDGLSGSILSTLLHAGIDLDHSCGGVSACSTCHIYVEKGFDTALESEEEEEDMLDYAPAVQDNSRLACCCVPDGTEDVVVALPAWNRNEVSENH